MKNLLSFFFLILFFLSFQINAQEGMPSGDEMKAWMEYMTPGEMHKMLANDVGEWHTKIKMWMAPGTEPMISEGTSVNEMILGGRYLKSTHNAITMGMPMEGISITAFDNAKKEFISIWMDNMGTGIMIASGPYDEATNTITLLGTMVDPMTGKDIPVKEVIKPIDENNQVFEMYMEHEGKEFKTMEIEYKRK